MGSGLSINLIEMALEELEPLRVVSFALEEGPIDCTFDVGRPEQSCRHTFAYKMSDDRSSNIPQQLVLLLGNHTSKLISCYTLALKEDFCNSFQILTGVLQTLSPTDLRSLCNSSGVLR